jgi:hypothetical protein
MFIDNVDDFYSQIWCIYVCGLSYMMYMLFVDSHVDDIVFVVINILHVTSI